MGLPKATARVDSWLKLTFGQLVSKSTSRVTTDKLSILSTGSVGAWLGLGLEVMVKS